MNNQTVIYQYRNEDGKVLYEVSRYSDNHGDERRSDGQGGWLRDMRSIGRVPYRLPELCATLRIDRQADVILAADERDCDGIRALGFGAVSSFINWRPSFNKHIDGRRVYLLADKDLAGWKKAEEVAAMIEPHAIEVCVVDVYRGMELVNTGGPDVSDWIRDLMDAGTDDDEDLMVELLKEMRKAKPWRPLHIIKNQATPIETTDNFFVRKSGSQWLTDAMSRPRAKMLFGELWHEGELCIMFADTNTGKSILGVQIGESIASGNPIGDFTMQAEPQKVIYFDFELSERQFLNRYAVEEGDYFIDPYPFHPNFERVEMDAQCEIPADVSFEDFLYYKFEEEVVASGAKVIVVDNITFLRHENEKARNASPMMRQLKRLKETYDLSLLVMAHTPKRNLNAPLTRNDLQGSKMIINFCDACFAIGESGQGLAVRYLKQIKERSTAKIYHGGNVPVAAIAKTGNFLGFRFRGRENERDHLRPAISEEDAALREQVKAMRDSGKSFKKIAGELNIHYKKAERLGKRAEAAISVT